MSKLTVIPAGYRITVDSWENDGDNSRTRSVEGLDLQTVRFYRDVCLLLEGDHGNLCEGEDTDELKAAFLEVVERHSGSCERAAGIHRDWESHGLSHFFNIHNEMFGYSEYYLTRVLEGFRIEHVPEPINIRDVTEEI